LNTHKLSTLYNAFKPAEARRLVNRFEVHYTPKHGSWLNRTSWTIIEVLSPIHGGLI